MASRIPLLVVVAMSGGPARLAIGNIFPQASLDPVGAPVPAIEKLIALKTLGAILLNDQRRRHISKRAGRLAKCLRVGYLREQEARKPVRILPNAPVNHGAAPSV